MAIVFGTGTKEIASFQEGQDRYTLNGRYFHIMFLSMFPIGKKLISHGPEGNFEYDLEDPQVQALLQKHQVKDGYGAGFFLFWIVVPILAGLLFGLYKYMTRDLTPEFNPEDYVEEVAPETNDVDQKAFKLLNNPEKGDYWIMRFPAEDPPFIIYKVNRITPDTIFCISGNYGYADHIIANDAVLNAAWEEKENYWYNDFEFGYDRSRLEELYYVSEEDASKSLGMIVYPIRKD